MAEPDTGAIGGAEFVGGGKSEPDGGSNLGNLFSSGATVIDPASVGGAGGSGAGAAEPGPRKRGRPKGWKKPHKAESTVHIDLSGLEKILFSIHFGLAMITRVEEFALDETEAKQMAEALAAVSKHYPTVAEKMGAKSMDHVNLLMVMGGIYGARFAAYKIRTAKPAPDNVTVLHPAHPNADRFGGPTS